MKYKVGDNVKVSIVDPNTYTKRCYESLNGLVGEIEKLKREIEKIHSQFFGPIVPGLQPHFNRIGADYLERSGRGPFGRGWSVILWGDGCVSR